MYHFTADNPPESIRLSFRAVIPGHIRQYLKDFQLDAIRFMHNFLSKGEYCVYNDESGLGKQAAVVVLLNAACSSRKCLIVVQNDDRYVSGWEFHFNVLTKTNVTVIKDEKDTTDSHHSIYIAKWSNLRAIDDLNKFKFDFIILDNRGQMLNNSFCVSMLLKNYERRINMLISSVDITSDLKLLHNVLRLGGRLDPQYSCFKVFEEKFKLPDAKELAYKRVDLEEYFCKRERLADYCKAFRLRRYCHQFETQLPLVKDDRYKINLELWREKQNATNSECSSVEYVNQQRREDEQTKDTQELFEEYCRQRRKQHLKFQQEEEQRLQQREREMLKKLEVQNEIIYNLDDEVALINDSPPMITDKSPIARDNSDEPVLMSPLLVESDSDADDTPEICNDLITDFDVVDLSSEEKEVEQHTKGKNNNAAKVVEGSKSSVNNQKLSVRKSLKKRTELDRLEEDIVDTLKIIKLPKRLLRSRKEKEDKSKLSNKRLNVRLEEKRCSAKSTSPNDKKTKSLKNTSNAKKMQSKSELTQRGTTTKLCLQKHSKETHKDSMKMLEIGSKENCRTPKTTKNINDENPFRSSLTNSTSNLNCVEKRKVALKDNAKTNGTSYKTTPLSSRKTRSVQNGEKTSKETQKKPNFNEILIKQEICEETPKSKKIKLEETQAKVMSEKTRSMQRLTRSVSGSKYLTKNLSLQIDNVKKPKNKIASKETPKTNVLNKIKEIDDVNTKQSDTNKNKNTIKDKTKNDVKNTQASIISHRSSQDYESLQCAQRLSDAGVFDNAIEKTTKFLMPPTPNAIVRSSLVPSSLTSSAGFFTESEPIFIPPFYPNSATTNRKYDKVISISSSDNENSTSQSSSKNVSMTSRRTRALKPKRNQLRTVVESNKMPTFSGLLVQQNTRSSAKSPDLFSNCSDAIQVPCTQQNFNRQEPNTPFEGFKIFGSEVKQLQQQYALNKNNKANKHNLTQKTSYREQRSCLDILENMFEPSNKQPQQILIEKSLTPAKKSTHGSSEHTKQKTHTNILPSHPIEAIAEARQQQVLQKRKRSSSGLQDEEIFEITNNGTFGSVMRLHSNGDISPVQHTQRTNAKQHNKITNYLIGNITQSGSQEEATPNGGIGVDMEAGTPSKRHHQWANVQNMNVKKSPKGKCNPTQSTKLTKWFTKPSELSSRESTTQEKSSNSKKNHIQVQENNKIDLTITTSPPSAAGKRIFKRRRLDLSYNK